MKKSNEPHSSVAPGPLSKTTATVTPTPAAPSALTLTAWLLVGLVAAVAQIYVDGFTIHSVCLGMLCVLLAAAAAFDGAAYRIPNKVVLCVLSLWMLWALILVLVDKHPVWWVLARSAVGALAAAGPVALLAAFAHARGKVGFGLGDIKFLFALGMFFSWQENLMALCAACVLGVAIGIFNKKARGEDKIPFGCAIALAWWELMVFGPQLAALSA